jgi:hypothetical protein
MCLILVPLNAATSLGQQNFNSATTTLSRRMLRLKVLDTSPAFKLWFYPKWQSFNTHHGLSSSLCLVVPIENSTSNPEFSIAIKACFPGPKNALTELVGDPAFPEIKTPTSGSKDEYRQNVLLAHSDLGLGISSTKSFCQEMGTSRGLSTCTPQLVASMLQRNRSLLSKPCNY